MFNKIAIIGVGEIGGSIGKACKKKKLAREIVGICRRKSSMKKALKLKLVDSATLDMREGVRGADLIILATPVGKIVHLGKKAASFAKAGALMADVGSTKREIVEKLEKSLSSKVKFVGSHPMAGSEKGGPESANAMLFEGKNCFITKTKNTERNALAAINKFWRNLGARPIEISLAEHDKIVGSISQMVHLAAAGLVIACKDYLEYAASGFRDTTRIALSDPGLWKDICATNNKNIASSLKSLISVLAKFDKSISRKDFSGVAGILKKAQDFRRTVS